jgi:hypothetical protein
MLLLVSALAARAADIQYSGPSLKLATAGATNAAPATGDTNSPVAQIQGHLEKVRTTIEASVKEMQEAVASSPSQHAAKVSNLANQIRDLAAKDLGDESAVVKGADALMAKMRNSVAQARAKSSDPSVRSRDLYGEVLLRLEAELGKLIDAKASVQRIRFELLAQADALASDADAIGFAEDSNQAILASTAFRKCLGEVVEFTRRLELLIHQVGHKPKEVAAS